MHMNDCIQEQLFTEARAPISTYRMQLHKDFSFADAEATLPYLKSLGIGDLYSSPIFEARPGSQHGYDVARHDRLNPELGGEEGFQRFTSARRQLGLGLLLDIVPNHMGVGNDSHWWQDVLENGRASEYAAYFDIDWTPLKPALKDKLLLPILGKQYGEELEAKHIRLVIEDGTMRIQYFDHLMPVAPRTLPIIFPTESPEADELPQSFRDLLRELVHIPPHESIDPKLVAQRREQLAELKPRLHAALKDPALKDKIESAIEKLNGVEGDPGSFDQLHALLESQPYRLAFWRTSSEQINYRRFFDVNDLVGLRMENPEVFRETHCLVRRMLARNEITGVRIDHCDGMFDPRQYLIRLQLLYIASQCAGESLSGPASPSGIEQPIREALRGYDWAKSQGPLYCVVEKILEPRESLPREWPVRGTSGYDFVHFANQIFIQPANERKFTSLYATISPRNTDPDEIIYRSKLQVLNNALASETYVLTNLLSHLATADRRARDFTDSLLETVIRETIACFPVYRTYIDERGQYTERDTSFIRQAIQRAKHRNADADASAFDFLMNTLLLLQHGEEDVYQRQLYFALKFQQLTGPVMAKGVEDTSFYVYNRFISSNEVGSSMKSFGISLETFHTSNQDRLANSPDALLGTSTHDTKRSEDVRNRLNVLSEMPAEWAQAVRRWQRMNAKFKRKLEDGRTAPDPNEEYLIYQTIAGAWPWQSHTAEDRNSFTERIKQYVSKALSEAKINVSWVNPNPEYLDAVHGFVDSILQFGRRGVETPFVSILERLMPCLKTFGAINSLAQVVLKVASPGVPDFYQGSDLWDLSLVDPDNRRPVDYQLRTRLLGELQQQSVAEAASGVLSDLTDGRVKLWTTHRALQLRNTADELFRRGNYVPITAEGELSEHLIAFLRINNDATQACLAAVPRFACTLMRKQPHLPLGEVWGSAVITLPENAPRSYQNGMTDEIITADERGRLRLSHLFGTYPVALCLSTRD